MKRRNFIGIAAATSVFSPLLSKGNGNPFISDSLFNEDPISIKEMQIPNEMELIYPNPLKKGSVVAVTAPASPTNMWEIHNGINFFQKMGCKIVSGKSVNERQYKYKYFSASDAERAKEFMGFIQDKSVDCILCARGGYGSMRILPLLDFDVIRTSKILVSIYGYQ